jgi:hypothetical protein
MWPFSRSSKEPTMTIVGRDLAMQVADGLDAVGFFGHSHRDYCGMGFCKDGGIYVYAEVADGHILTKAEMEAIGGTFPGERLEFTTRAAFVDWLSAQSDSSLSGMELPDSWLHSNQRITVKRLREFAANNSFKPNPLRGSA